MQFLIQAEHPALPPPPHVSRLQAGRGLQPDFPSPGHSHFRESLPPLKRKLAQLAGLRG